jgi:cytoskeletal protein RodZ
MNNTTQTLIGFIGIIMIGYLFVAVFQCKSVNNFVNALPIEESVSEEEESPNNTEEPTSSENKSSNKSSSNNNLQGSPTDVKEDIMFSEKQVTSIFKTQFNYGNLIYFSN